MYKFAQSALNSLFSKTSRTIQPALRGTDNVSGSREVSPFNIKMLFDDRELKKFLKKEYEARFTPKSLEEVMTKMKAPHRSFKVMSCEQQNLEPSTKVTPPIFKPANITSSLKALSSAGGKNSAFTRVKRRS